MWCAVAKNYCRTLVCYNLHLKMCYAASTSFHLFLVPMICKLEGNLILLVLYVYLRLVSVGIPLHPKDFMATATDSAGLDIEEGTVTTRVLILKNPILCCVFSGSTSCLQLLVDHLEEHRISSAREDTKDEHTDALMDETLRNATTSMSRSGWDLDFLQLFCPSGLLSSNVAVCL